MGVCLVGSSFFFIPWTVPRVFFLSFHLSEHSMCGASIDAQLTFYLLSVHALFCKSHLFFLLYPLLHAVSIVCTLLLSIYREHRIFLAWCLCLTTVHLRSCLVLALWVSFSNSELQIFSHHPCDLISPLCSLSPVFLVQKYVWGCVWDHVWGSANVFSCELVSPSCFPFRVC